MLCKAIAETGRVALARVVIGQRERTIALRSMPGGLVAHTLDEQRDINDARSIFGNAAEIKTDPEMVALAKQLIDRQTTKYDPSDLEDRYETRLRAMIDAKLKGEGIDLSEPAEPDRSNVVDLMAALKKSLGARSGTEEGRHSHRLRRNRSVPPLLRPPSRGANGRRTGRHLPQAIAPDGSAHGPPQHRPRRRTRDPLRGGQPRNHPCHIQGIGNASVHRASRTSCQSGALCLGVWFRVGPDLPRPPETP